MNGRLSGNGYNYYPFGLTMAGTAYTRIGDKANRYLYNGKELQDDLDLNWYDYGARMYMPELGRFGTIDQLANTFSSLSPYNYAGNNPIFYIDKDGNGIFPSLAEFMKAGLDAINNVRFQALRGIERNGKCKPIETYCNIAASYILRRSGDDYFHKENGDMMLANNIGHFLNDNPEIAVPINAVEALDYANKGVTIIASWINPDESQSGHVTIVAPGTKLKVFHIGAHNKLATINEAFGSDNAPQVRYYLLVSDELELERRDEVNKQKGVEAEITHSENNKSAKSDMPNYMNANENYWNNKFNRRKYQKGDAGYIGSPDYIRDKVNNYGNDN